MTDSESDDPVPVEDWIQYKKGKAIGCVERGYCVEWLPAENHWMSIYRPGCAFDETPELRATAKFYGAPSQFGIDGGCVSKLEIRETTFTLSHELLGRRPERSNVTYRFDRGPDIDHLIEFPDSRRLYLDILELLN